MVASVFRACSQADRVGGRHLMPKSVLFRPSEAKSDIVARLDLQSVARARAPVSSAAFRTVRVSVWGLQCPATEMLDRAGRTKHEAPTVGLLLSVCQGAGVREAGCLPPPGVEASIEHVRS